LAALGADALADQLVEVTAYTLNVRAAPSANAPIVGLVNKHDQLAVRPVSDNWAAVLHGTEINGFVYRKYIRTIERNNTIVNGPKPTDVRIAPALFAILLISVAIALFLLRQRKRTPGDSGSEYVARETKVADTRLPEPHHETPQVRRNFRDEYQERVLHDREEKGRVEDLSMAKVEYVIDGDTVIVSSTWRKTKVRLDSIDCPEDGQPWGDVAAAGLIKMIGGRRVRLEEHGEDRYGRLLATIYVRDSRDSEWLNVNEKMVVKGHAWVMRKYFDHLPATRKETLIRLERWARMKKVGLWNTSNPIPPWRWRRRRHEEALDR
jgi:endonuclease YncB( thermonuclease family)